MRLKTQEIESQGMRLMRALRAQGMYIFTHEEAVTAANAANVARSQLNSILSNLVNTHFLLRLRRGLYAGMGSLPGEIQTHPFAIATKLVEPAAISHWSALQLHGLTEQVPQIVTTSTPRKIYTPSMRLGARVEKHGWNIEGVRYEYVQIKPEHFFGIESIWIDERFQVPVTDKERTVLDLFVFSRMFGGMGEAFSILEQALPSLDIKKLVNYTLRYNKKFTIKRLGWALESCGIALEELQPLLEVPVNSYCSLDPNKAKMGIYHKRWMIQENI